MNRARTEAQGRRAERWAAWYLRLMGWRILARRLRIGHGRGVGEVDLVARRGCTVIFVEVKWRRSAAAWDQAIDARRLARVARAAHALLARFAGPRDTARIDVILLAPWRWPRHITHVWQD